MNNLQNISEDMVNDCLEIVPETEYIIAEVNSNTRIDKFVEGATNKPYNRGSAFYRLSKKELIQKSKLIYVQDKETKNVYRGDLARQLLGLPDQDINIYPTYNARYDIYVQSKSLNRKLTYGEKILILI